MGDGRRSGQGSSGDAGAQVGTDRPLEPREVPGILLALLVLAAALGGSAAVAHFALRINWTASFAAAPLLLMVATLVGKVLRKHAAEIRRQLWPWPLPGRGLWRAVRRAAVPVVDRRDRTRE
jgi:hypothetical protein